MYRTYWVGMAHTKLGGTCPQFLPTPFRGSTPMPPWLPVHLFQRPPTATQTHDNVMWFLACCIITVCRHSLRTRTLETAKLVTPETTLRSRRTVALPKHGKVANYSYSRAPPTHWPQSCILARTDVISSMPRWPIVGQGGDLTTNTQKTL